ncbi:hypothetical protein [Actinokineospora sp.]|uniref:hypothetical protein n=1 Tax=Actinokineospora sp. TaxID=1872133 RepID=UPI004037C628
MRTLVSWLLGLVGVAAAAIGVIRPWYEDRVGTSIPLADLFEGVRRSTAPLISSIAVPIAIALLLVLVGLLVSQPLLRLGGLLLLVTVVVWVVRARAAVEITDLQSGVWNVGFGSLLIVVAGVLRPRRG